jgi:hypothetical protein
MTNKYDYPLLNSIKPEYVANIHLNMYMERKGLYLI